MINHAYSYFYINSLNVPVIYFWDMISLACLELKSLILSFRCIFLKIFKITCMQKLAFFLQLVSEPGWMFKQFMLKIIVIKSEIYKYV